MEYLIFAVALLVFGAIVVIAQMVKIKKLEKKAYYARMEKAKLETQLAMQELSTRIFIKSIAETIAEMFEEDTEDEKKTPLDEKIEELINLENDGSMNPMERAKFLMGNAAKWAYESLGIKGGIYQKKAKELGLTK